MLSSIKRSWVMKFDNFIMGVFGYGVFIALVLLIIMLIATLGIFFYNELTKNKEANNRSFYVALIVCIFVGVAITVFNQPEISFFDDLLRWFGLWWILS